MLGVTRSCGRADDGATPAARQTQDQGNRIPYRVPEDCELPDRLPPVLTVVYLIYNAGLANPTADGVWGR
jgi:predicted RNA polymerase sigma factor